MDKIIVKTYIDDNGNENSYETFSDEAWQNIFDNTPEPLKPSEAFKHIDEKYRSIFENSSMTRDELNEIEYLILKEKQSAELSYYNVGGSKQEIERITNKHKQEEREHYQRILNNTYDKERNEKLLKVQQAREKEFITPEEFELLFDLSVETQKQYRRRKDNPIPVFGRRGKGNKVLYRRTEAEKWNARR